MQGFTMRVRFTKVSSNAKTGPIGVTMTESASCPDTCALKAAGCYARFSFVGIQWRQLDKGTHGIEWDQFIKELSAMPSGYTFRHNVAGDLLNRKGFIDHKMLGKLVQASNKKQGFTYTHHVLNAWNIAVIRAANRAGFTINVSCDNLDQVDNAIKLGLPAATILPEFSDKVTVTPAGNRVVTCPATYRDDVTCANCGNGRPLCARADRVYAIGFPVHGAGKKKAEKIFMLKREG